ncbi:hypothetical protein PUN4_750055 [Paraburkholderia unamae]|nr:hypothetical protein PUN4_750055 [Paraburkholderia unamae]
MPSVAGRRHQRTRNRSKNVVKLADPSKFSRLQGSGKAVRMLRIMDVRALAAAWQPLGSLFVGCFTGLRRRREVCALAQRSCPASQ